MLLTVVADYGTGDLAFAEVRQRFALLLPDADVAAIPVPPFDTVSAGFCVAQLAFGEGPADRVVYANVAPRQDEDEPREDNAGERLVAARPDAGSQFRSRDVFPSAVAGLVHGDDGLLGDDVTVALPPERALVYTDGYGNLKTSWYDAPAA